MDTDDDDLIAMSNQDPNDVQQVMFKLICL